MGEAFLNLGYEGAGDTLRHPGPAKREPGLKKM